MPTFPSVEWFKAAGDLLNKSDSFKRLGTCDTEMAVQVDDRIFELDFEAFELADVKEIDTARAEQLDFVLVQPYEEWKNMLLNIKEHGQAAGRLHPELARPRQRQGVRQGQGLQPPRRLLPL